MNYVDATLIKMADPTTRTGLLDQLALAQMLSAAYDTDAMAIEEPFSPVFDEFRIGYSVPKVGTMEGNWNGLGGGDRTEARFQLAGLGNNERIRVDAFWRGAIIARTAFAHARITRVATHWPSPSQIDADIVAAIGALPADAVALENARRGQFVQRVKAALDQPDLFSNEALDRWLSNVGAKSVSDLLSHFQGVIQTGATQIEFSQPVPGPTSPKPLPVAAALLIRDAGFSVAELLAESKVIREQLEPMGIGRPQADASAKLKEPLLVVWVIPEKVFEDADWPGAAAGLNVTESRKARRLAAGKWLAREGIGLVAIL